MRIFNRHFPLKMIWRLRRLWLSLMAPSRIRNVILIHVSLLWRSPRIMGDPIVLMVEPSSRCNLQCPMCPRQLEKNDRWLGEMSWADFQETLDDLGRTLMFLILFNYGEPLLNPHIARMIQYAVGKGIGVGMSTNGTLLTRQMAMDLIVSGLHYLIIPLDGATKRTYEQYRKNSVFEETLDNIRILLEERRLRKKVTPILDLQFLVMRDNEKEIGLFKQLATSLGVDMYTLKKVGYVKGREKDFLPSDPRLSCSYYFQGPSHKYCKRLSLSSVINANGDVTPCCSDIQFQHVLGNIFHGQRFREVWNNESYQRIRTMAYRNEPIGMCRNCAGSNFDSSVYR